MAFEDVFPKPIKEAIEAITKIPTYGERGASRFVYNLLKLQQEEKVTLVDLLQRLVLSIKKMFRVWAIDRQRCMLYML